MIAYALKLGGAMIAVLLLGVLALVIFDAIWFRVGFGAAAVIFGGLVIFFAWRKDRRDKELRAGLPPMTTRHAVSLALIPEARTAA